MIQSMLDYKCIMIINRTQILSLQNENQLS